MADEEATAAAAAVGEEEETTPGYKAPAQKSLAEIQTLDADDESLVKYKQALLAGAGEAVKDEGGSNVIVKYMSLVVEGREDMTVDLTGDISKLKEKPLVIKEGTSYRLKVGFRVQREIVAGLRYSNVTTRKGIRVDKNQFMVGSYGPKNEVQTFLAPVDEAPSGMLARGTYIIKSKFHDDDKNVYLEWETAMKIDKDWQ